MVTLCEVNLRIPQDVLADCRHMKDLPNLKHDWRYLHRHLTNNWVSTQAQLWKFTQSILEAEQYGLQTTTGQDQCSTVQATMRFERNEEPTLHELMVSPACPKKGKHQLI
jgi:hypothetical protein